MNKLSEKEQKIVLRVCCDGMNAKRIAQLDNYTIKTVEWHLRNIYRKCGLKEDINKTVQLVRLFYSYKILNFC